MVHGAIFDIDGTLVNSVDLHAEAWQRALAKFGKQVPYPRVRHEIGKGGDVIIAELLSDEEVARFGTDLEAYRGELYRREYMPRVRAMPRVRELFQALIGHDIRIALASSAPQEELAYYVGLTRIEGILDVRVSADDVARSKPSPDVFQAALGRLELTASAAIVVGDTPWDALAAGKLRLRTIGVLSGGFPAEELRVAGAIAIYRDVGHLLQNLESSPLISEGSALHARSAP